MSLKKLLSFRKRKTVRKHSNFIGYELCRGVKFSVWKKNGCQGCCFLVGGNCTSQVKRSTLICSSVLRKDKQSVIFKRMD